MWDAIAGTAPTVDVAGGGVAGRPGARRRVAQPEGAGGQVMSEKPADFLEGLAKKDPKAAERLRKAEAAQRFAVRTLGQFRKPEIPKLIWRLAGHRQLLLIYGGWGSGKS